MSLEQARGLLILFQSSLFIYGPHRKESFQAYLAGNKQLVLETGVSQHLSKGFVDPRLPGRSINNAGTHTDHGFD